MLNLRLRSEGGGVDDQEWSYFLGWLDSAGISIDTYDDEADLVAQAVETLLIYRAGQADRDAQLQPKPSLRGARRARMPMEPEWWPYECERALEEFREDQRRTMVDFELQGEDEELCPAQLGEVRMLVQSVAEREPVAGERLLLTVPTGQHGETPLLDIVTIMGWRGRWPDSEMDFLRDRPGHREVPGEGRFARLYDRTKVLTNMTGCDEEEAVAFLLCDRTPWMPWIEVDYDARCDATLIRVRHPEVSAAQVAEAYRGFRPGSVLFDRAHRQRRRRLWPERVERFVDMYRTEHPDAPWNAVYAAFCSVYAVEQPARKYTTMRGFQSVYYLRKRRPPRTERPRSAELSDED